MTDGCDILSKIACRWTSLDLSDDKSTLVQVMAWWRHQMEIFSSLLALCTVYVWCDEFNQTWWNHQMETFPTLLALCVGNSLVTSEFPSQRPVTRSFDVFFHLRLNKLLSKQLRRRWFEMPSRSSWHHCMSWKWSNYIAFSLSLLAKGK